MDNSLVSVFVLRNYTAVELTYAERYDDREGDQTFSGLGVLGCDSPKAPIMMTL